MKAISLWQPWASLWACGRKTYETRHWAPTYRGPLAIHAAQKICVDLEPELVAILEDEFGGHWALDLPRGALIGWGELSRCISTDHLHVDVDEAAQGNFSAGRYAWELSYRQQLARPVPCRGRQALFDVPPQALGLAALPSEQSRSKELF